MRISQNLDFFCGFIYNFFLASFAFLFNRLLWPAVRLSFLEWFLLNPVSLLTPALENVTNELAHADCILSLPFAIHFSRFFSPDLLPFIPFLSTGKVLASVLQKTWKWNIDQLGDLAYFTTNFAPKIGHVFSGIALPEFGRYSKWTHV